MEERTPGGVLKGEEGSRQTTTTPPEPTVNRGRKTQEGTKMGVVSICRSCVGLPRLLAHIREPLMRARLTSYLAGGWKTSASTFPSTRLPLGRRLLTLSKIASESCEPAASEDRGKVWWFRFLEHGLRACRT